MNTTPVTGGHTEDQRGFMFAHDIHGVVLEYGPEDLSNAEKSQLADVICKAAIDWIRARNVQARATRGTGS